jgi:hypothetical protein
MWKIYPDDNDRDKVITIAHMALSKVSKKYVRCK